MAANLIMVLSERKNAAPYKFVTTGINVYSFEQALYHCYHYWRESWDEIFIKDSFIVWVRDELKLPFIAEEIKCLKNIRQLSEKMIKFLSVVYYFDGEELEELKAEIEIWEKQSQSQKLKEKGDGLISTGNFEKAVIAYKAILEIDENNYIAMNNIGIGYMKQGRYEKAIEWFLRAYELDKNNVKIILNLIEGYVYMDCFDDAEKFIEIAEKTYSGSEIDFFKGEVNFRKGSFFDAVIFYKRAVVKNDIFAVFRLSDLYFKQRKYDAAIEVLNILGETNSEALMRKSRIYAETGNISAAVRCVEKALVYNKESAELWTLLAKYYRINYDFIKAEGAACTALRFSRGDKAANLEMAKIRKAQGRFKEYRISISKILKSFKNEYRDIYF